MQTTGTLRKFVRDTGCHFYPYITLCGIVAHCFVHLLPLCLYSVIHPLSFSQSLERLLHPFSVCIPIEECQSLSSPFTHALLVLYLICKEHFCCHLFHLFVLCPFLTFFSYCPIMACLLMPHFSLSFP